LSDYPTFLPHIICEYARMGVINPINCVALVGLVSSQMEETLLGVKGNCDPTKNGGLPS